MASRNIVVANWKMNPATAEEAAKLLKKVAQSISRVKKTQVVVCPPYIYLSNLKKLSRKVALGAQDAWGGEKGPQTGEVSTEMLYNLGARYVILGHSERRALGESSRDINKKIKGALVSGLIPVICIGERGRDENHQYFDLVKNQIRDCLNGISKNSFSSIIIAYEPVWSISTTANRRDATAEDSYEMSMFIRKILSDLSSPEIASKVRIIYGGSVNEKNAGEFVNKGGVSGLLVGGASLDSGKFFEIIKICEASKK